MKRDKVNQIEDSPPRLKLNIVLNVLKGKGNPNIKLRPFMKYAKDTLVDKI